METEELYTYFKECKTVTTDSRKCPHGSLFFALQGNSFDGNAYASAALENGCSYAVIDNPAYRPNGDARYLLVRDSLKALQQLATYHRRIWGKDILQITGTNGKTTTKELVATVLKCRYNLLYTEGNLNNHIGVPLTLLRLTPENDMAVIETGANHPGEIDFLSHIVEPNYGLITNVGKAHLEGFGSFEGVIQTKTELFRYLEQHGPGAVFLNNDNPYLQEHVHKLTTWRYGSPQKGIPLLAEGFAAQCSPLLTFRWRPSGESEWHEVHTHMVGIYNTDNFLAAIAVGLHFGITPEAMDQALSGYTPHNNRSQLTDTGRNRLIVDAYNANPTSMMAALNNFLQIESEHKMLILGDMRELGPDSDNEHLKIIKFLKKSGLTNTWLVGEHFCRTGKGFRTFKNVDQVIKELHEHPVSGQFILIKGSNGTRLSVLPDEL